MPLGTLGSWGPRISVGFCIFKSFRVSIGYGFNQLAFLLLHILRMFSDVSSLFANLRSPYLSNLPASSALPRISEIRDETILLNRDIPDIFTRPLPPVAGHALINKTGLLIGFRHEGQ